MGFSLSDIFSGFEDELKDFGRKFDDYVFHGGFEDDLFHGGFEDELRSGLSWVDDQIVKPIYRWQKAFFQAMADDPAYAVVYVATAIYAPHLLPLVIGIKAKSDGAEWGDAIYAGVMAFATQQIATAPVLQSIGARVGSAFTYGLGGGATAAAIGGLIADGTASGLAAGGIAVTSGESFEDGFTSAFIGTIVSAGTTKILGYVEDKLPQGLKYKTQARNDAGQIIDASGKRVYESKAGTGPTGADDITKVVTDNGVVRKAAEVFETFPPVVQDMLSTAITAELMGRDVTPEMMYSVVANTYLTTEVLGGVLSKIPGVDFSSEEGQNFLVYLTPAVQLSVVQAASMGLTEQSGALAMRNVMDAVEAYGVDSMFRELFDSVEDNPVMQDLLGVVDTLTGKAGVAQAAADQAQLDTIAYGEAVSEHNLLNNEGYDRYQAYAEEREKYEENGGLAYVNAATAWREGGPATQGFTTFEDYYGALAQINGYPSIAQIKVGKAALDVTERALVTFNRENEDRLAELSELIAQPTYTTLTPEQAETTDAARLETITNPEDGTKTFFLLENGQRIVEIPGGDLTTAFQNSFQAFREAESLMLVDFDDLGDQIIANIVPEVQRDLVLATTPFFDEEYYTEKYGDQFADEINAFGDFTTVGAKEGRFVSQGQADAFEGQAKEIFKLQVAEGLSPGNGMGYLDSVNNNIAARTKFNAEVDRLWQENFFDEFGNFQSYKFEDIQFVDPQGYVTDSAYSDVPVYATLTAEEAAVGDRGWDKVINEDGSETFFLLEGGERVVSGYDSVQNDFVRKPPEAWEATVEIVAANVGFFDSIQIRKEDLATQSLDNFSSAELANILSSGGVAYGASGKLEFINITTDGDDKFSMFDPVTGESNYLVNGISFDYLKENDTKSYVELTHTAYNAFSERIGVSANAYNADRLAAVELEQMVANGVIDYSQAIALSYMGIQKKIHSVIAEGMYDTGEFLIDGTIAQFDPDNPYGLLDWSNEGVTAKFDMWSEAINNLEETTKALPQNTVQAGKTTGALALQGVAELGQSYLSMARFIGNNPADLSAHQFLEEMIGLGESWKSEEWKASAANLSANLAERGIDDPNTPENEAIWGTMQVMGGAFEENPMAFLGEVIFKEGIQELIPLIVGGGFGYVAAKGGAKVLGTAVSEKFALNMGFLASTALDIAESAGGTAEGAYQDAFYTIRASLTAKNSETGYSERQINMIAERYAQDIAVSNGVYAAMVTGAMMFAGGAALDKQVFGTFGSKNINEEAFRTWGTRLNAAFATSGKESIAEFVEEFAINDHMEGMLYEWDDTRNITGNNWFAGTMGAIIAGPVTGTMAAFMQPNPEAAATGFTIPDYATATGKQQFASTGSTEADLLLRFNPNIASAVYGNSSTLEADLDALGVNYGVYRALGDAANDPDFTGNPLSVPNPTTEIGRPTVIEPDFDNFPTAEAANDNLHYDVATNTTYRLTNGTWDARGAGDNTSLWGSTPDPVDLDSQLTTLGDVVDRVVTDPTTGVAYRVIHNVVEAEPDAWNAGSLVVTTDARAPVRVFDPSSPYALNGPTVADVYNTLAREFGGDITGMPQIASGVTEISVSDALSHGGIYAGGDIVSLNGLMRAANVMASHVHSKIGNAMNALRTAGTSLSDNEHAEDLLSEAKESLGKYYSVMEDWLPAIRSTRSFLGLGPTIDNLGGNFASAAGDFATDGDGVMEIPGRFAPYFFNGEIPYEFSTRGSSSGTLSNSNWGITSVGGLNEKLDSYFSNEALVVVGNNYIDILNDGTGNYIAKEQYTGLSKIDPADLSIWADKLLEARAAEDSALSDLNGAMTEGHNLGGTGGDPYADRFEQPYYDALDARYNAEADYEFFYDKVLNQDEQYLKLFRSKAVENGWTISDSNNYILRNGEDILETMDSMTSEPGTYFGSRYLQEDLFDNYFVNNTDASKNFANIDASPRLSLNQFKDIFIRDNGLSEAEYYAALGPGMGATNEEKDANVKAFYLDAVRDPNDLDAFGNPVVGVQAESPEVISFIDGVVNTEAEVIAAYKAELGQDYVPTAEEIDKYIGTTFSLDGDGVAVYDNPLSAIDDAFTSESEIADIMRGFGYTLGIDSDGRHYYNLATGDRITSAEASEIIDPRKTVAENSTAYSEYFNDLGVSVTAEEQAATLARIQDIRDSANMPEDNSGGPIGYGRYVGPYPEIANPFAPGSSEAANFERELAILNASGLHPDSYWYNYYFDRTVNNDFASSNDTLNKFADKFSSQSKTVEDVENYLQRSGYVPGTNEYADVLEYYLDRVPLGYQPYNRQEGHWDADTDAAIKQADSYVRYKDVYDAFEILVGRAPSIGEASYWGGKTEEEFQVGLQKLVVDEERNRDFQRTVTTAESEALLITRFGMSNMTWDAEQGKNVPNQEMADIIARHFDVGVGAEGSRRERLNAGVDSYRTELIEDKYGITPTPEQLERLRDATTTQWMNDPEILQARRDLAAANNAKTLSPMELAYYLADLGVSYNADDGIYRAIIGMAIPFTGEGGPDFDATQRAAVAAEVTRLRAAYDAENDAAQQLADTKQAFIDAGYTPTDLEVEQFLTDNAGIPDFIENTVKPRVKQVFIDAGYDPDAATVDAYLNNTAGIAGFVQGKRNDTAALFGDYNPSEDEVTAYLNNNTGIAQYVDDNTITEAEVKKSLEDQDFVVPEDFNYEAFTGKKPESGLAAATQGWRDANTVTEAEVKKALEDQDFVVPEDFNYDAFTGKNKPDTGIKGQVDTYLAPRQYTRDEAIADLETELGRSLTQEEIDDGVYDSFLAGVVQLNGDTNADATGKTQVESGITNVADVRSYLQGLDYDTTGLSNEDLLAFAGTGLGIDLGTATSEYQTANETITQRDARLAAEAAAAAELQRQTAAINAALDDATQDGGAYTPGDRQGFIDWFVNNKNFEGKTAEEIKATIYDDIDNKRYTRSEVADDLRAAFPADAGLSVEELEAKYAGAFDLVKTGAYATDGEQRTAFGAATTTEAEARDALEATGFVIPDGFDFTNFTGVMDATQLGTQISTDLAPLQYTRADAEAALAAELGRTLTAEDLTTYKDYLDGLVDMTGARTNAQGDLQVQGDITSQADINAVLLGAGYSQADIDAFNFNDLIGLDTDLDTELSGFTDATRTVAQQDTATDLLAKGWTGASDADIAEVQGLDSAERDAWVAERQFTEQQAIDALAAQGITADHPQFQSLVDQLVVDKGAAGTFNTQGALVDDPEDVLIDQYIITQAEIDAEMGGYSYFDFAQTPLGVTPGVADDTTLAGLVQTHVKDNYVQADAAREALDGIAGVDAYEVDNNGEYVITDDQLVGLGLVGQYDPTTLGTKVDGATTTEAEVIAAFGENYNPTDAEIARYMGLLPDGDLGTDIPAYVANRMDTLVSDVGDLSLTVSQLEDRLNGALAEGGSLDLAVSQVANDLGIAEEALLKLIGDNSNKFDDLETAFGTQATDDQEATGIWANIAGLEDDVSGLQDAFGTQGVVDDPNTLDIDESSPATGIYGIIDQVAQGVLSNDEAIALLEGAVGVPATYDGNGALLTPATGIYAQSGEGVNADVLQAINAVYDYVGQADFASEATVQQVADLLGKPADLVTQDDIDYATQITQGNITATFEDSTGSPDLTYDALYDVNNDGFINGTDVNLMVDLYGGVDAAYNNIVEGLPEGSRFASTGVFGILDQQNRNQTAANEAIANQAAIDAQANADTLADINTQVNANINVQNQRYLQGLLAEEARLGGSRRIDTTNKDPGDIEYMYDFEGIFANQGQEDLYGNLFGGDGFGLREKAAATGGLIDSTDELLKILGK